MATVKRLTADVSSVGPSSERIALTKGDVHLELSASRQTVIKEQWKVEEKGKRYISFYSLIECPDLFECVMSCFLCYLPEKGKPTIIRSSLYVESFGNIEEANMVRIMYKLILCLIQNWANSVYAEYT